MMRQTIHFLFAVVLLGSRSYGQVGGPRLGYVWDEGARGLRSVDGIPGAAFVGRAADPGIELAIAAVSQRARYILGIAAADRSPYLVRIGAGISAPQRMDGAMNDVNRIALSPFGTSAALYSTSGTLQVITGLPEHPVVAKSLAVTGLDRMTVSDDGALVVLTTEDGSVAMVAADDTEPLPLPISGPVSSMAFRPRSHDVLIGGRDLVTLVHTLDAQPTYETVADVPPGPVALAFASDGLRFVAAYSDGRVRMSDFSSREVPLAWCPCQPNALDVLQGDFALALRTDAQQPLFLFDGAKNRVVFVGRDEQ